MKRGVRQGGWLVALVAGVLLGAGAPPAQGQASGSITVNILRPAAGAPVPHEVMVLAQIQSTYSVQSVVAQIDDRQTSMVFTPGDYQTPEGHRGNLSLWGLPKGDKALTVTVTDVLGNVTQAQRPVIYDTPPVLTVLTPDQAVARPDIRLAASCVDETPCTVEVGHFNGQTTSPIAAALSSLDVVVPLERGWNLLFTARDSLGQITHRERRFSINTNRHLVELDEVPGVIWDVRPDRILFFGDAGLQVKNRSTGAIATVLVPGGRWPASAYLTPVGVIYSTWGWNPLEPNLYDWRNGSLVDLGEMSSENSLQVNGNYAVWAVPPDPCCFLADLVRRDLTAGTNLVVAEDVNGGDAGPNGDVVYSQLVGEYDSVVPQNNRYEVFRYRDGVAQQLSNDPTVWSVDPVTDGVHVLYDKSRKCCVAPESHSIAMHNGSTETILSPPDSDIGAVQDWDYAAEGGWVAFRKRDAGGVAQIWTRESVRGIGPAQPVRHREPLHRDDAGRRGLVLQRGPVVPEPAGGTLPTAMGPSNVDSFNVSLQDGRWLVHMGPSLFRISPVALNVPAAPSGVSATPGDTTANVSWAPPADTGGRPSRTTSSPPSPAGWPRSPSPSRTAPPPRP